MRGIILSYKFKFINSDKLHLSDSKLFDVELIEINQFKLIETKCQQLKKERCKGEYEQ